MKIKNITDKTINMKVEGNHMTIMSGATVEVPDELSIHNMEAKFEVVKAIKKIEVVKVEEEATEEVVQSKPKKSKKKGKK